MFSVNFRYFKSDKGQQLCKSDNYWRQKLRRKANKCNKNEERRMRAKTLQGAIPKMSNIIIE